MKKLKTQILVISLMLGIIAPTTVMSFEVELKKGATAPINGVLLDFESYREIVAIDMFHEELKKSYLTLSSECQQGGAHNNDNSIKNDVIKVLAGIIVGGLAVELVHD